MAKKKYTSYQPSKTLWQVEIPSHWQETDLRMVFSENKERNTGLIERNLLSLSYGKLKRKDIDNATGLVPASFEGYQIIGNGYIVLRFTDLQNDKKSLRVGYSPERGIITNAYVAIAPKENTFSKYYYYQLHFLDTIKYFYNLGGGVRQSLSYKEFGRETVIVPEPEEQTKISAFLDYKLTKIDRFILKKKQLIKLLNEQKAAIINQAVTKGLDSNAKMKTSGIELLGEVPNHWEIKPLKYFATHNDEALPNSTDKNYSLKYIDISNVDRDGNINEVVEYAFKDAPSRARRVVKNGDVIISTVRTYLKAIARIVDDKDIIVSTGFAVLRPKSSIESEFLNYVVRANYFIEDVCSNSYGVSYPAINASDLVTLKLAIPDTVFEQQKIVQSIKVDVEIVEKTISTIEKEITLTQEYKTALIAEAVTGKIDVRDFEVPETLEDESYEDIEEELSLEAEGEAEYQNEDIEE